MFGLVTQVIAAGESGEPEQTTNGDGIADGFGAIVIVLDPEKEMRGVSSALPKPARFSIVELPAHALGQLEGKIERRRVRGWPHNNPTLPRQEEMVMPAASRHGITGKNSTNRAGNGRLPC